MVAHGQAPLPALEDSAAVSEALLTAFENPAARRARSPRSSPVSSRPPPPPISILQNAGRSPARSTYGMAIPLVHRRDHRHLRHGTHLVHRCQQERPQGRRRAHHVQPHRHGGVPVPVLRAARHLPFRLCGHADQRRRHLGRAHDLQPLHHGAAVPVHEAARALRQFCHPPLQEEGEPTPSSTSACSARRLSPSARPAT